MPLNKSAYFQVGRPRTGRISATCAPLCGACAEVSRWGREGKRFTLLASQLRRYMASSRRLELPHLNRDEERCSTTTTRPNVTLPEILSLLALRLIFKSGRTSFFIANSSGFRASPLMQSRVFHLIRYDFVLFLPIAPLNDRLY